MIIVNVYRPPRELQANYTEFNNDFAKLLNKLHVTSKELSNISILGDFNYNFLKVKEYPHVHEFLDNLLSCGYLPHVTMPSRICRNSITLIDNIFIKQNKRIINESFIFASDLSDHFPCCVLLSRPRSCQKAKYIVKRAESDENLCKLKSFLNAVQFNDIITDNSRDVNYKYNKLDTIITDGLNQFLPKKTVKFRRNKHPMNPWLTKRLLRSINYKNKLYREMIKARSNIEVYEVLRTNYITYRQILSKLIKTAKKTYYSNYFDNHKTSMVKTWSKINDLIKGNGNDKTSQLFKYKDQTLTEPKDIANNFNTFFASIGRDISNSISGSFNNSFDSYLSNKDTTFSFKYVTPDKVRSVIANTKSKTSCGVDGVSTKILKFISEPLLELITHLINLSFDTGIFPHNLKTAKVVPIFKKNEPTIFDNYRPISLLPAMSKVFERCMADQLLDYFETNTLFYTGQYGFRANRSTELAALELVDRINLDLAKHLVPCCIFMDLSKAFDTINHHILLTKLQTYGLDQKSIALFESYLTNRQQCVIYENVLSEFTTVTTGVPQGSILGPILFIIYINDLINCCPDLKPIIYADDTTLYFTYKDANAIEDVMNNKLKKIVEWLQLNKLSLNAQKTKMMVFQKKKSPSVTPKLSINNTSIDLVDEFNFLGIMLDKTLTFKPHKNKVMGKLRWSNFVLNKLKNTLPLYILRMLYFALVQSHLNYGILIWGHNCNDVYRSQKKSIRIITTSKLNAHTSPLFKALDILTISDLYTLNVLKFYYKYTNDLLPLYFHNFELRTNHDRHYYQTRYTFTETTTSLHQIKASLRKQLPVIINNSPANITDKVHTHSLAGFACYFKRHAISNYEIQCLVPSCYVCNSGIA